ncbi:MAG: TssA family type VI secretion system protein [Myxococcota bacterium]
MPGESAKWVPGQDVAPLLQAVASGSGNARLSETFAKIEAEIAKLKSATKQAVNWATVATESEAYLKTKSKDLQVGTYLAMAWVDAKGAAGLRRGLDLLVGLLGEPWETLFPPLEKMKARAGALSWFSEILGPRLAEVLAKKLPDDEGKALVDSQVRYQAIVAQRFPEGGASLQPIEQGFAVAQKAGRLPPPPKVAKPEEPAVPVSDDPILQPIPGDSRVGVDPKLTDEFDQLYPELQKIGAVDGGDVQWKLVRDLSLKILTAHAKDLRCVVYWGWARFCIDGPVGLREGLAALAAFTKHFGDEMHPKRPKARSAALRWIGARLEEDLPTKVKSVPEADMNAMKASLEESIKTLEPLVKTLEGLYAGRKGLGLVKVEKPKPKPKPKPAKPAGGAKSSAAAKPAGPPAEVVPEELKAISEQMLEAAQELVGETETAASLRLRRQALWLSSPPLVKGKKYECESPSPKERLELEGMFKAKRWDELLERTEEMFPSYPFYLDLTFWAAKAAGELVGDDARRALAAELAALTIRSPKLTRGTDGEGRALTSKDTRAFITQFRGTSSPTGTAPAATSASPAGTAGAAGAAGTGDGGAAPAAAVAPEQLPAEIEQLFKDGKVNDAVSRASASAAGLTGRAAFQRNLLLAERLVDAKSNGLAFSLFRALLGQLRKTTLTQWEPTVGARCIRGYLRCARATKAKLEDGGELLDELMLLDPSAAIGLV